LIRHLQIEQSYDKATAAPHLMTLPTQFHDDIGDVPPIKFETGHQGKEAERLTQFIWNRVMRLLLTGKELEANSLLEEFDEPPLWDNPLD
jgi:hypothetical protein